MLKAVTRQASAVDAKIRVLNADLAEGRAPVSTANFFDHHATPEDIAVMVTEQDFLDAHRELIPSVSAGELQHYERVRATFEGGRDKKKGAAASPEDPRQPQQQRSASTREMIDAALGGGKGKGKAVAAGKGKGKAVLGDSDGDEDEDEDGAYGSYAVNGKGKGKGKAVAGGFEHGTASDDEGLY